MNKYRLNQLLETLLFPVIDLEFGQEDLLLDYYLCYQEYMDEIGKNTQKAPRNLDRLRKAKRKIVDYVLDRSSGKIKSEDDIQMLLELYHPMNEIAKNMQKIALLRGEPGRNRMEEAQENISFYYLHCLSEIAHSLVTYRDGISAIRYWSEKNRIDRKPLIFEQESVYNKVEIWNLLCRFTVPDIYIVMVAVDNQLGMEALYEQKAGIALADKLVVKAIQKGVAENHIHFNVGFDYEGLWLRQMDLRFVEQTALREWSSDKNTRMGMAVFRCMAALFLETEDRRFSFRTWLLEKGNVDIQKIICQIFHVEYAESMSSECYHTVINVYNSLKSDFSLREYDYLMDKVYGKYLEYKTSSEFIFLYKSYCYLANGKRKDTWFARIFIQYLRYKNSFYYSMYERHTMQGLKFFQKRYHKTKAISEAVMDKENMFVEIFRSQAKVKSLKKLEVRIAPPMEDIVNDPREYKLVRRQILPPLYKQLYKILYSYKRYILESTVGVKNAWDIMCREEKGKLPEYIREEILKEITVQKPHIPTLGIVYHFLKAEYYEDISGYACWKSIREKTGKYYRYKLLREYYMRDIAMAIEEIRSTIPVISEYIVGIDAASDENASEPWMFSMIYKEMRSLRAMKPVLKLGDSKNSFSHIQNIGYTFHVGEDYRHLVSGLRHVDEVLKEFGFKAGDRLGHALVLGTDVEKWVADNEVVPLPVLEYLENLLWMWGINTCEGIALPIQLEVLEDRIINIAKEIYGKSEFITVKMLYDAYKKKFCEPEQIIERVEEDGEEKTDMFCCHSTGCEKKCYSVWNSDILVLTNYCPVFEERYAEKKMVSVDKNEIALLKSLQEYLIDKVEKNGIYIETNPTSNLSIGDFSDMQKHPIFALNQIGDNSDHHVLVTINSDDPAVFNTNVENEFAYIYYAAENQGISKEAILDWVEKVREYGMTASFIQQVKSAEQIYFEIDSIMREIRNIINI